MPYEYKMIFFKKIIKRFILDVFYYPKNIFNLNYQFHLVKIINKLLAYKPNIILQNTINYQKINIFTIFEKKNNNINVYLFCQSYYKNKSLVEAELITLRKYYVANLALKLNVPLDLWLLVFGQYKIFIKISKLNFIFLYLFRNIS